MARSFDRCRQPNIAETSEPQNWASNPGSQRCGGAVLPPERPLGWLASGCPEGDGSPRPRPELLEASWAPVIIPVLFLGSRPLRKRASQQTGQQIKRSQYLCENAGVLMLPRCEWKPKAEKSVWKFKKKNKNKTHQQRLPKGSYFENEEERRTVHRDCRWAAVRVLTGPSLAPAGRVLAQPWAEDRAWSPDGDTRICWTDTLSRERRRPWRTPGPP